MSIFYAFSYLLIAVAMAGAVPSIGPMQTPMGMMATIGFSPLPTEAPGSNGIPQELRKRQNIRFPPPAHWCGFIEGSYSDPLSCNPGYTCVNSLNAIGCCTATTGLCTNIYTTCFNYGVACDSACQLNPAIRKCDARKPYCGTYSFPGSTFLYNCGTVSAVPYSVEFLNDYYVTAIGSTLASDPTTNPFGFTAAVTAAADTSSASSTTGTKRPTSTSSYSSSSDDSSDGGLSDAAIDGIAAAGAIVGAAVLGLVAFCCVRQRKKKRMAKAAFPNQTAPPMYQSVPQQEQLKQPGPYAQNYNSPPAPQLQQQHTGYFPPPGAPSQNGLSPQQTSGPRDSTANNSLLFPQSPPSVNGEQQRQSYYKPPHSPTVTEVDGTMGNPGITSNFSHGTPMEVDGTLGNPGVPAGGIGIQNQMQPGGSPSATEIDGRGLAGTMNQPFSTNGPYEIGHGGR